MTAEVPTQGCKTQQVQVNVPPRKSGCDAVFGVAVTLLALCVPGGRKQGYLWKWCSNTNCEFPPGLLRALTWLKHRIHATAVGGGAETTLE